MIDDSRKKYRSPAAASPAPPPPPPGFIRHLYDYHDADAWSLTPVLKLAALAPTRSLDELMARDKQREKDGFPRKIRLGKVVKPGGKDDERIVVVPTTTEEKFLHDAVTVVAAEGEGTAGVLESINQQGVNSVNRIVSGGGLQISLFEILLVEGGGAFPITAELRGLPGVIEQHAVFR